MDLITKEIAINLFMLPINQQLMKPDNITTEQYKEWLNTYTLFIGNEYTTLMIKVVGDEFEFHIATNPLATHRQVLSSYKEAQDLFTGKKLRTTISEKHPNVSSYLCKRFNFTKQEHCNDVMYNGITYKQYIYTNH